nr:carbohydrate-binding domain-containing protein [Lachnospiraceae bacterium]
MKKILKRLTGLTTAAAVFVYMPVAAFARPYDITHGDVNVVAEVNANGKTIYTVNGQLDETQIVIGGDSGVLYATGYHVYIESRDRANALIVFNNLAISNSTYAVKTAGDGNVTIELNGDNMLQSGGRNAGIQKENTGTLTIKDDDKNGRLEVLGGSNGAGIGGGDRMNGTDIIIEGGTIEATGGYDGAGIGGGFAGKGDTITIKGGTVTAKGGDYAAGIGGGYYNYSTAEDAGKGMNITIEGGTVTAEGGFYAAGIGGGSGRNGENIVIGGGTVTAE